MGIGRLIKSNHFLTAAALCVVGLAEPLSAQRFITAGQTVSGELDASDRVRAVHNTYYDDWFYEGRAGERIIVEQRSRHFDPWLLLGRVVNGAFEPAMFKGRRPGVDAARLYYTFPATGRYVIRANAVGVGETGAYTLHVTTGVGSAISAVWISPGSTVRGSLQAGSRRSTGGVYSDLYTFTGSKGDVVSIDMIASEFDPYLQLYRGTDQRVASDDNGGEGLNARIQYVLTDNGMTYLINARSRLPDQTGSYTLSLRSVPGQTGARPGATTATGTAAAIAGARVPSPGRRQGAVGADPIIALDESVDGSLTPSDADLDEDDEFYRDLWRFSGRAGQRIRITLTAMSDFIPVLGFWTSDESGEIISSDEKVAEGDDATIDVDIPVSGEYQILVTSGRGPSFGDYRLTVRSR